MKSRVTNMNSTLTLLTALLAALVNFEEGNRLRRYTH